MTVYVDTLMHHGWHPPWARGKAIRSCHMFTDQIDLTELHDMAARIGMKREWFQDRSDVPHYDLTASRRERAVALGAFQADRILAVNIWRGRRQLVAAQEHTTPVDSIGGGD